MLTLSKTAIQISKHKIMKNLFFAVAFFSGLVTTVAQSNNPFNARGIDFLNSFKILTTDYRAGKIKSLDQTTLDYYSKTLPGKPMATVAMAAAVVDGVKKSTPERVIEQSGLSAAAKDFLKKSLQYNSKIDNLVSQVNLSKLSASEKELVLTSMAVTYHLRQSKDIDSPIDPNSPCTVDGQPATCASVGAGLGMVIGGAICGLPCAVGGALIGGLVGSLKD